MYISVNSNNEIKKVGIDENLTVLYVDETNPSYPWNGWSEAKICCYKVKVNDEGIVTMMTPYIWSNNLEVIDMLGQSTDDNSNGLFDMADATSDISDALFELADYVAYLEERINELTESEE